MQEDICKSLNLLQEEVYSIFGRPEEEAYVPFKFRYECVEFDIDLPSELCYTGENITTNVKKILELFKDIFEIDISIKGRLITPSNNCDN